MPYFHFLLASEKRSVRMKDYNNEKIKHWKAFHAIDQNRDNFISLQELASTLKRMQFPKNEVDEMFDEADEDGNGVLDFNEFIQAFK